jgi:very-short-patch-repair endonuclease
MPLPADSSQIAACLAAAQDRDFVIVGPPGTGKSQTIANMIATCLAARKTVLFVAEKTAALDVVYRRLREHGLGDHCLELHSSKADRKHFFAQLKRSWETRGKADNSQWVTLNDKLQIRRDELNGYTDALHARGTCGLTPYAAIGIAMAASEDHAPALTWVSHNAHDERAYKNLEGMAEQLGLTFAAVKTRPVLQLVQVEDWSGAWQERLLAAARKLGRAAADAKASLAALSVKLRLDETDDAQSEGLAYFAHFARDLVTTAGTDQTIILYKDFASLSRAIRDLEYAIESYRGSEHGLSTRYGPDELLRVPVDKLEHEWREARAGMWPISWFAKRRVQKVLGSYADAATVDPAIDLPLIRRMQGTRQVIQGSAIATAPLPFRDLDTDCEELKRRLNTAEKLRNSLVQLGEYVDNVSGVAASIAGGLKGQVNQPQIAAATDFLKKHDVLGEAISEFETLAGHRLPNHDATNFLASLVTLMEDLEQSRNLFRDWSSWCAVRRVAVANGLAPLVADIESGAVTPARAVAAFRAGYVRWWLPLAIDASRELRSFRRFTHENAVSDFRAIDDLVRAQASAKVVGSLVHGLPSPDIVPKNSELGRLRHQMALQRPSNSIRDMITAIPESFSKLAPCVLMSPLSIAQYLPTHQALFDVVIFDEASQIATWDAVGAIARGRQTVIVGDPKQLPPTNFFGRNDGEDESVPEQDRDLESILDEAQASGLPTRRLRWHYRSRHESLIAFSNWHYYDNNLITFPSPVTQDQAVSLAYVPAAVYDRGNSRTNSDEARAIVSDIRARLTHWISLPEPKRPTLGVITFNIQQQTLIQDLLDEVRRGNPAFEWFFSEDRIEPLIVKNLENIQGDERDVILFSITFCRDAAGKLPMTFGAINRTGGERRLNVAVTRARRELKVFSGLRADDIDLGRSKARGVAHLKAFLDYAVRGAIALPSQDSGSQGPMESPFEMAVAAQLERRGWQIVPQVGVSGFRIDLGVKHPDHAGLFLAGIECDGATYHSSATARDRDKVREDVLTGLGWRILRVWSTDWWFNLGDSVERLHQSLNEALEVSRSSVAADGKIISAEAQGEAPIQEGHRDGGELQNNDALAAEEDEVERLAPEASLLVNAGTQSIASLGEVKLNASRYFTMADLSSFKTDADLFFDYAYAPTLQAMIDAVMDAEAPLREDVLAQRVARAHGWLRTGARIREQISRHLRKYERVGETPGTFLWKAGTVTARIEFRVPYSDEHRRSLAEISIAELVDFIKSNERALEESDPPLTLARLMQIERLAATSRNRLQEAIAHSRLVS